MSMSIKSAAVAVALLAGLGAGTANAAMSHTSRTNKGVVHEQMTENSSVTGKIESIHSRRRWLVLGDHTYRFGPKLAALNLHRGESVRIEYHVAKGHRWATEIRSL